MTEARAALIDKLKDWAEETRYNATTGNFISPIQAMINEAKLLDEAADALRADAEEVERLQRARVADSEIIGRWQCQAEAAEKALAPLREGPVCLLSEYKAMRDRAVAAEARVKALEAALREADRLLGLTRGSEVLGVIRAALEADRKEPT